MRLPPYRALFASIAGAAISLTAAAQSVAPAPESGYGDDLQVVVVAFDRFLPLSSNSAYNTGNCCTPGQQFPWNRWLEDEAGVLITSFDAGLIPNGADLVDVSFYVFDSQQVLPVDIECRLCRSWVDIDGDDHNTDCPLIVATSLAPGHTVIGGDPNIQVRYQQDVDNDGTQEVVSHFLTAHFANQDVPGQVRLHSVRLLYRRQVSPAPPGPTFSDVPPSHPFFQFVEALAASGITAGCGSGIYCPDAPLTRGQMAVFLAKALGLHWPGPVAP
jgi:hypothetical protein